ncbi:uncharacterized protein LOC121089632 [Falco naumanni]|uniref:uncharacterized protein LOC121089632 n=1 Tax=Falco naumanni TaxID=148594 RepID=UPI001ADDFCE4|nr:uncharacterized protein LOC121089632 [Falco naumanni]
MDETSVGCCDHNTALGQPASLLFYVRCSDGKTGQQASVSPAPSYDGSFLGQQQGGRQQADPVGPRDQLDWTKDMTMGMEDSAEDRSSWPHRLSITSHVDMHHHSCGCRRLESCTRAACPHCRPPFDHVLHTVREDSHREEHRFSPSSHCQRNGARERTWSRSPQRRNDLCSCFMGTTDCKCSTRRRRRRRPRPPSCHHTPRDNTAPGPSKCSSQYTPAPRAAPREQPLPMQRARSRSLWHRYDLHRQFTGYHPSATGMRTGPPTQDHAPRDNRTQWPSHSSSHLAPAPRALLEQALLRQREWTRSLRAWLTSTQLVKNTHS